jgi:hypothetical protein
LNCACAEESLELRPKALYFVQPRSENFGIVNKSIWFSRTEKFWKCDQKHCTSSSLFRRAEESFRFSTKALYFLFSRANKSFGIATKSTAFCSTAQRKDSELRTKSIVFCSGAQRGIANKALYLLAAQQKFWNCEQKHSIWFSGAEEILELQPNAVFIQPTEKSFGIAPKAPYFVQAQRKILEL